MVLEKQEVQRLSDGYDVGRGYVMGEEEIRSRIDHMADRKVIIEELRNHCDTAKMEILKCLGLLQKDNPEVAMGVKTRQAIRSVLNNVRDEIHALLQDGLLEEAEGNDLAGMVESKMKKLLTAPPRVPLPSTEKILQNVPWIADNENLVQFIKSRARLMNYEYGDIIMHQDDPTTGVSIILSGLVKLLDIDIADIQDAFSNFDHLEPPLKYRLWRLSAIRICTGIFLDQPSFQGMTKEKLRVRLENGYVEELDQTPTTFSIHPCIGELVLLHGHAVDGYTFEEYNGPCYIPQKVQLLCFEDQQDPNPAFFILPAENCPMICRPSISMQVEGGMTQEDAARLTPVLQQLYPGASGKHVASSTGVSTANIMASSFRRAAMQHIRELNEKRGSVQFALRRGSALPASKGGFLRKVKQSHSSTIIPRGSSLLASNLPPLEMVTSISLTDHLSILPSSQDFTKGGIPSPHDKEESALHASSDTELAKTSSYRAQVRSVSRSQRTQSFSGGRSYSITHRSPLIPFSQLTKDFALPPGTLRKLSGQSPSSRRASEQYQPSRKVSDLRQPSRKTSEQSQPSRKLLDQQSIKSSEQPSKKSSDVTSRKSLDEDPETKRTSKQKSRRASDPYRSAGYAPGQYQTSPKVSDPDQSITTLTELQETLRNQPDHKQPYRKMYDQPHPSGKLSDQFQPNKRLSEDTQHNRKFSDQFKPRKFSEPPQDSRKMSEQGRPQSARAHSLGSRGSLFSAVKKPTKIHPIDLYTASHEKRARESESQSAGSSSSSPPQASYDSGKRGSSPYSSKDFFSSERRITPTYVGSKLSSQDSSSRDHFKRRMSPFSQKDDRRRAGSLTQSSSYDYKLAMPSDVQSSKELVAKDTGVPPVEPSTSYRNSTSGQQGSGLLVNCDETGSLALEASDFFVSDIDLFSSLGIHDHKRLSIISERISIDGSAPVWPHNSRQKQSMESQDSQSANPSHSNSFGAVPKLPSPTALHTHSSDIGGATGSICTKDQPLSELYKAKSDQNHSLKKRGLDEVFFERNKTLKKQVPEEDIYDQNKTLKKQGLEEDISDENKTLIKQALEEGISDQNKILKKQGLEEGISDQNKTLKKQGLEEGISDQNKTLKKQGLEEDISDENKTLKKGLEEAISDQKKTVNKQGKSGSEQPDADQDTSLKNEGLHEPSSDQNKSLQIQGLEKAVSSPNKLIKDQGTSKLETVGVELWSPIDVESPLPGPSGVGAISVTSKKHQTSIPDHLVPLSIGSRTIGQEVSSPIGPLAKSNARSTDKAMISPGCTSGKPNPLPATQHQTTVSDPSTRSGTGSGAPDKAATSNLGPLDNAVPHTDSYAKSNARSTNQTMTSTPGHSVQAGADHTTPDQPMISSTDPSGKPNETADGEGKDSPGQGETVGQGSNPSPEGSKTMSTMQHTEHRDVATSSDFEVRANKKDNKAGQRGRVKEMCLQTDGETQTSLERLSGVQTTTSRKQHKSSKPSQKS